MKKKIYYAIISKINPLQYFLEGSEKEIVLDAGCGEGDKTAIVAKKASFVCAIDISLKYIKHAKRKIEECQLYGLKVELIVADIHHMPFRPAIFDKVICTEVLEHVTDDVKACKQIYYVLQKGGKILISVPSYKSELAYKKIDPTAFPDHIRIYMKNQLLNLLEHTGFINCYAKIIPDFSTSLMWLLILFLKRRGKICFDLSDRSWIHCSDKHPLLLRVYFLIWSALGKLHISLIVSYLGSHFFPKSIVIIGIKEGV